MERHLAGARVPRRRQLTLADIALYAYTHVAHEGGFDLAAYPAIRAWLDRVAAEPGHVPIDARTADSTDSGFDIAAWPFASASRRARRGRSTSETRSRAVANRRFADERGGALVLRIDDTDPTRTCAAVRAIRDRPRLARDRLGRGAGAPERARRVYAAAAASGRARTGCGARRRRLAPARRGNARCARTGARPTSSRPLRTTSTSASRT